MTPAHTRGSGSADVLTGEVIDGKYRVDRLLGEGGMGKVVAATHTRLGQKVAIKYLLPKFVNHAGVVERFEREARAAVRLRSEHVVRVMDVGHMPDGAPMMVMEYLEGQDLDQISKARGPLPLAEAAEYVIQACEAIGEAHANGIIHRDLKPQNLFVTRRVDGRPLVKVLDFGISKMLEGEEERALTQANDMMGSPSYMSPEQLMAASNVDARSDIWALGILLFKLLCARVPFDGETLTQMCMRIMRDPPRPLHDFRPDVPAGVAAIIDRCLDKDPARRFQSVRELVAALEPVALPAPPPHDSAARLTGEPQRLSAPHLATATGVEPLPYPAWQSFSSPSGTAGNFDASSHTGGGRGARHRSLPLLIAAGAALATLSLGGAAVLVLRPRPKVASTSELLPPTPTVHRPTGPMSPPVAPAPAEPAAPIAVPLPELAAASSQAAAPPPGAAAPVTSVRPRGVAPRKPKRGDDLPDERK